jgi:hypothetical protein
MATNNNAGKFHCPHCDGLLSKESYEAHKRLYLDNDVWIRKRRLTADDEHFRIIETEEAIEQFDFDASESNLEVDETDDYMECADTPPPEVDFNFLNEGPTQGVGCGSGKL